MPRLKKPNGEIVEVSLDELNQMLSPQESTSGFGSGFMSGLTNMPADFVSSLGGLRPLATTAYDLVAGDRAEAGRNIADILGGIGGTSVGAVTGGALGALGGAFAPVTVPLGATIGGYLGGTLGGVGTDYAVQALRGEETPTIEDLGYAMGGGLPYVLGGQVLKSGNRLMPDKNTGMTLADRLEGKAIGARATDYSKSVKQKGLTEQGQIPLQQSIQRVGETGVYKENIGSPLRLMEALEAQKEAIGQQMTPEINRLEALRQQAGLEVSPNWTNAEKEIASMRGTGAMEDFERKVLERILNIQDKETDLNTLTGLHEARQNLNKDVYGDADPVYVNNVSNALRADVRKAQLEGIDKLDPNSPLKTLLRDYGDREEIIQKILKRDIGNEATSTIQPRNFFRTTGGLGMPLLASAYTGNPYIAGTAIGLDALFNTPTGQLMLADLLRGNKMAGIPRALQQSYIPMQQTELLTGE